MTPGNVRQEINTLVRKLVTFGLVDDYQPALERKSSKTEISFANAELLRNRSKRDAYFDVYSRLVELRSYTALMFDGSFVQLWYLFEKKRLLKHRLAFYPPPESHLNQLKLKLTQLNVLFSDILKSHHTGHPLRFDYDFTNIKRTNIHHPKSHLTLIGYDNCRIPLTSAVTPYWFFHFILQNFYSTKQIDFVGKLPKSSGDFSESITKNEKRVPYFVIPRH